MKTSSAKAKGRKLQQYVRDRLRSIGQSFGLVDDDIESRGMGQNGSDIILTPAARDVFTPAPHVECKNQEALNVSATFYAQDERYPDQVIWLVHKRNHKEPLITMRLTDFLCVYLVRSMIAVHNIGKTTNSSEDNTSSAGH